MTPERRKHLRDWFTSDEVCHTGLSRKSALELLDALDAAEAGWKQAALELDGYEGGAPARGTRLWRCEHELTMAREEVTRLRAALETIAKGEMGWQGCQSVALAALRPEGTR